MSHLKLVYSAPSPQPAGFNARDLMALSSWVGRSAQHGYSRIHIEGGDGGAGPENGAYVLVYETDHEWASWGLARAGDRINIWHCGTGADMCAFPEMTQALESLPPVGFSRPIELRPIELRSGELRSGTRERVVAASTRPRLTLVHQS